MPMGPGEFLHWGVPFVWHPSQAMFPYCNGGVSDPQGSIVVVLRVCHQSGKLALLPLHAKK